MSSVVDWLKSIAESIISLPINLIEGIIDGIKAIFIPDTEIIQAKFDGLVESIYTQFGFYGLGVKDNLENLTGQPVDDVEANYKINGLGTMKLKFFDSKYFQAGVSYFRPFLRGFIVLLLFFYNYKQLLTFIGQDPTIAHNAQQNYEKWREKQ